MSHISRKAILAELHRAGEPVSLSELSRLLNVSGQKASRALLQQLDGLKRSGLIIRNRRNRFALSDRMDMVKGRVIGHRDGYGFVENPGPEGDLFLSAREMRKVLHGDRVMARVKHIDSHGRAEGRVVELLEAGSQKIVGRFVDEHGLACVVPDDQRIGQDVMIGRGDEGGASNNQIVTVEITEHPYQNRRLFGRVVEVLGDQLAPGMETEIAIRKYELPHEFPDAILNEMQKRAYSERSIVPVKRRRDLTGTPLVTIDGADARDFDDAVYAEPMDSGWRLVVAIADVSHYVKPGTDLDGEALSRGTSVYFPARVIPMLPEQLSNGICSLNPGVDRYAMVCDMSIDGAGIITGFVFYEAMINSHARLTYESVQGFLDHPDSPPADWDDAVVENLRQLETLFKQLNERRMVCGTLDLEIPEPFFDLDDDQRIRSVGARQRLNAHRLIEECMLAANVCASNFLDEQLDAGVFRIHEKPSPEKLSDLVRTYSGFGLGKVSGDLTSVENLMHMVNRARSKRPVVAEALQMMVLRSMKQAHYGIHNDGHYALGFDSYTHFTSPIRRYPDLLVHRLIKSLIYKKHADRPDPEELVSMTEHCSVTERRAEEATRDVYRWLKAEYMQDHVGEEFTGRVSGVTQFGVFVQLDDLFIDGLVHISELGKDYFHFDPIRLRLQGERSGQVFELGTAMSIKVAGVDLDDAKIDFVPSRPQGGKRKSGKWSKI